uniref:Alternative protein APP n=1 Tax=Homo sapiens TaxID=9606 RepID=L8EC46_HUMAN|nr:alternative protein APP [Homo sapiens]
MQNSDMTQDMKFIIKNWCSLQKMWVQTKVQSLDSWWAVLS